LAEKFNNMHDGGKIAITVGAAVAVGLGVKSWVDKVKKEKEAAQQSTGPQI
jgi:hypothetical protein